MSIVKFKSPIKKFTMVTSNSAPVEALTSKIQMHEGIKRPEILEGRTYKVVTPVCEEAMYITINDIILNAGTEFEERRPFEIFINSKNMDSFQWIVALTRVMSAVFRKGGEIAFLIDELHSVFDPKGGYFKKGGGYQNSLIAEIGDVIKVHLISLGNLEESVKHIPKPVLKKSTAASTCPKCNKPTYIRSEGCGNCTDCGYSSCS